MSTYIGIKCKTCQSSTGSGCKYYCIKDLWKIIYIAKELEIICDKTDGNIETRYIGNIDFDIDPTHFVIDHIDHDMAIFDEYGYEYDKEGKRLKD